MVLHDSSTLHEDLLNLAVVDDDAVPPGALAESTLRIPSAAHPHPAGEEASAIRKQLNLLEVPGVEGVSGIRLLLFAALSQAPGAHHEGIVYRQAVDLVNTTGLDRIVILLVSREVRGGARRSEGARESEDHDALALEDVVGGDVLPCERVVAANLFITNTALEGHRWDGAALCRHRRHACRSSAATKREHTGELLEEGGRGTAEHPAGNLPSSRARSSARHQAGGEQGCCTSDLRHCDER
mmetsp:Transcript_4822/g.9538  ORF Transcript_4822/g.9538 Transcript_4822/m.9538 type:complete len:241 (-) Transcript_4822:24-746(-)